MICKNQDDSFALEQEHTQGRRGGPARATFKACAARVPGARALPCLPTYSRYLRNNLGSSSSPSSTNPAEPAEAVSYIVDIIARKGPSPHYGLSLRELRCSGKCLDDDGGRVGPRTGHEKRAAGSSVDNRPPSVAFPPLSQAGPQGQQVHGRPSPSAISPDVR